MPWLGETFRGAHWSTILPATACTWNFDPLSIFQPLLCQDTRIHELVLIVHCADPAFDHPPCLERIRLALHLDSARFAINQPFVTTKKNARHRFVRSEMSLRKWVNKSPAKRPFQHGQG